MISNTHLWRRYSSCNNYTTSDSRPIDHIIRMCLQFLVKKSFEYFTLIDNYLNNSNRKWLSLEEKFPTDASICLFVTQTFVKLCFVSYAKRIERLLPLMKRLCTIYYARRNFQSNNDKLIYSTMLPCETNNIIHFDVLQP
jgi:hypothetical protein